LDSTVPGAGISCAASLCIDGVDDGADLTEVVKAAEGCGLTGSEIFELFRTSAGILHLGNIDFCRSSKGGGEGSEIEARNHLPSMFITV
jgi:myosin heavy subunit